MFTGIVESTAKILKKLDSGLVLERPKTFDDIKIGSSVAVSGACLSVIAFDDRSMTFDVIPTTFEKTKLGTLKAGDSVNLERAMLATARFEGHIVTGHIETIGVVDSFIDGTLSVRIPKQLMNSIVSEGSVTLDGVALTVADLKDDRLTVALIPHTLAVTTLGNLKKGDTVNVETDILAKYLRSAHGSR